MSGPLDETRFDATLRRYLVWESDQVPAFRGPDQVAERIAAGTKGRWTRTAPPQRVMVLVAAALLLTALIGALAILSGRIPFPTVLPRNGDIVVALDDCTLGLLHADSGAVRELAPAPPGCGPELGRSDWHQFWSTAWSADGSRMVYTMIGCFGCEPDVQDAAAQFSGLWMVDLPSGDASRLLGCPNPAACMGAVGISSDGARVAYTSWHDHTGEGYLTILNADRTGATSIDVGGHPSAPSFSPDGQRFVISTRDDFTWGSGLHVVNADGSGMTTILETDEVLIETPQWSPIDDRIVFRTLARVPGLDGVEVASGLSVLDADGTNPAEILRLQIDPWVWNPTWSADGQRVAYQLSPQDTGAVELWSIAADGSDALFTIGMECYDRCLGSTPSPDGRAFAFAQSDLSEQERGVFVLNVDGTGFRRIFERPFRVVTWQPIR